MKTLIEKNEGSKKEHSGEDHNIQSVYGVELKGVGGGRQKDT